MAKKSDKKKVLFTQKVDEDTLNDWKRKAAAAGISVAELIRRSVSGQSIDCRPAPRHRPPPSVDPELIRQVAGIGNNLNQIARRLNSGEKLDALPYLVAIERELSELVELAKEGRLK